MTEHESSSQTNDAPLIPDNPEKVMDVYRNLGEDLRHYANMQFAQMTIWVAISAGGIYLLFSKETELISPFRVVLELALGLIGLMFLAMNERVCEWWDFFYDRRNEFEKEMKFPTAWFNERDRKNNGWLKRLTDLLTNILRLLGPSEQSQRNSKPRCGPHSRYLSNRTAFRGVYLIGIVLFFTLAIFDGYKLTPYYDAYFSSKYENHTTSYCSVKNHEDFHHCYDMKSHSKHHCTR